MIFRGDEFVGFDNYEDYIECQKARGEKDPSHQTAKYRAIRSLSAAVKLFIVQINLPTLLSHRFLFHPILPLFTCPKRVKEKKQHKKRKQFLIHFET